MLELSSTPSLAKPQMVGFDLIPKPLAREQLVGPKSAHTKRSHQYPDVRRSVLLPAAMGTTLFAGSSEDADCVNMWSFAEEEKMPLNILVGFNTTYSTLVTISSSTNWSCYMTKKTSPTSPTPQRFGLYDMSCDNDASKELDLTSVATSIPNEVTDFGVRISASGTDDEKSLFEYLISGLVYRHGIHANRIEYLKQAEASGHVMGSADGELSVRIGDRSFPCRVNAASCNNQNAITLTVRATGKNEKDKTPDQGLSVKQGRLNGTDDYPIRAEDISRTFWDQIYKPSDSSGPRNVEQGLIVIAGSTNSGKSQLMRPIINEYLATVRKRKTEELLHLVTLEDPIEKWFSEGDDAKTFLSNGVVYTPRVLGVDVRDLKQALRDAKRQTPACFVVGEIRKGDDWREVVDFATSGHLIIATTHASSVRETVMRIFKALDVSRSQERRQVANSILSVVHAELLTIDYESTQSVKSAKVQGFQGGKALAQIPMAWIGKPSAVNQLTVDGLSSVLPNDEWCLSRNQFLQLLQKSGRIHESTIKLKKENKQSEICKISADENFNRLKAAAWARDINELRKP